MTIVVSADPSCRVTSSEIDKKIRITKPRAECVTCGAVFATHFQYRSCYACNTGDRAERAARRTSDLLEAASALRGIAARKAEIKAEAAARAAREKAKLRKEGR